MDLVKNTKGENYSLVTRGVFTKKVRAKKAGRSKHCFVLPVRLNQELADDYFMQHVE